MRRKTTAEDLILAFLMPYSRATVDTFPAYLLGKIKFMKTQDPRNKRVVTHTKPIEILSVYKKMYFTKFFLRHDRPTKNTLQNRFDVK